VKRHRNGDRDIRALERTWAADPSDDIVGEGLLAARVRFSEDWLQRIIVAASLGNKLAIKVVGERPRWGGRRLFRILSVDDPRVLEIAALGDRERMASFAAQCAAHAPFQTTTAWAEETARRAQRQRGREHDLNVAFAAAQTCLEAAVRVPSARNELRWQRALLAAHLIGDPRV
jgi:hypothetical protein